MGDREKFFLNVRCGGNNEGTVGASLGMLSVVLRWIVQVFIQWVKYCLYVGSYKFGTVRNTISRRRNASFVGL
jgi:hypothetical protein